MPSVEAVFRFKKSAMAGRRWLARTLAICGLLLLGASQVLAAIPASERAVLLDLFTSTAGPTWVNHENWGNAAGTECTWYGVICDEAQNHVTGIDLGWRNNLLTGPLPSLSGLTELQFFQAASNPLSGPIPTLSGLTKLRNFNVAGNGLTGGIPALSGLNALEWFNVATNQLSGPIPDH